MTTSQRRAYLRSIALSLLVALVGFGCKATLSGTTMSSSSKSETHEKGDADELRKKQRELECERIELEMAEVEAKNNLRLTREEHNDAQDDVEQAERELDLFREEQRALKLTAAELDLQSAQQSVDEEHQELEELLAHFAQEEFAVDARELVISRKTQRLKIAEQRLEMQKRKLVLLVDHELPKQERDLEQAVKQARRARRVAKEAIASTKLANGLSVMKLEHSVDELERELVELGGEVAEADSSGEADEPSEKDS